LIAGKSKKNITKDHLKGGGASSSHLDTIADEAELNVSVDNKSSVNGDEEYDDEVTTYDVEVDNASVMTGPSTTLSTVKAPDNTTNINTTPQPPPPATPETVPESEPAPAPVPVPTPVPVPAPALIPKKKIVAEQREPKLVAEPTTTTNTESSIATTATPKATKTTTQNTTVAESTKRPAPAQDSFPDSKKPKASSETTTVVDNNNDTPLQVILLLMDSNSRRFELIQLAFDAEKASVKDVIGQIALSATEEALKSQTYTDVCLPDGFLMKNNSYLKDYNDKIEAQKNMLLAIPTGMKTEECTKLAVPILNDAKVKAMLSGIDTPKPTKKEMTKRNTTSTAATTGTSSSGRAVASGNDASSQGGIGANASFKLLLVLLAIVVPILTYVHIHVTSTLSPGDVLPTGHWRSKCGLLEFPRLGNMSPCFKNERVLSLTPDGILSIKDEEGETVWEMKGKCSASTTTNDKECVARIGKDGNITIGSKLGKLMEGRPGIAYPWPFTVEPSTKTKKRRKKKTKKN